MFKTFDVQSVAVSSSASFDHGVEYPAQIVGLWNASKEFQGNVKSGVALLVLLKDNNDTCAYRSMFVSLEGYVLGQKAAYGTLMRGLLRCSDSGAALKEKINAAGLNDLRSLIGRPCLARMVVRDSGNGRTWANIESLSGETARAKGLCLSTDDKVEPVDIQRVCGKFVKIPSIADCITIDGLQVLDGMQNIADGIGDVIRDSANMNVF